MLMAYTYSLNAGQYVLMDGERPIGRVLDEVAIGFSRDNGVLHKHGAKEDVEAWAAKARDKYRAAGFGSMAEDIHVMSGRFPLEELNRCLSNIDHAGRLYARILGGSVKQLPPVDVAAGASVPTGIPRRRF